VDYEGWPAALLDPRTPNAFRCFSSMPCDDGGGKQPITNALSRHVSAPRAGRLFKKKSRLPVAASAY
jgi:hypothetical protein